MQLTLISSKKKKKKQSLQNNLDLSTRSSYNTYMMKTIYILLRKDNSEYYGVYNSIVEATRMQQTYRIATEIITEKVKIGYTFEE